MTETKNQFVPLSVSWSTYESMPHFYTQFICMCAKKAKSVTTLEVVESGRMEPIDEAGYSLLYSEHQPVYSLRVERSHIRKVYDHKGKPHITRKPHMARPASCGKTCFSIKASKQIIIAGCKLII